MISFQIQQATYLGFVLDSVSMTVSCPPDKIARLQSMCRNIMKDGIVTVHDAEHILGTMESVRPVTPLCALHYRAFQKQLLRAKASAWRPKQVIHLSSKTIASLAWWVSTAGFFMLGLLLMLLLQLGNWTPLLRFGQMLV